MQKANLEFQLHEAVGAERVELEYPPMEDRPFDELNTLSCIAMAYTWLLPTGKARLRDNRGRYCKVFESEYFEHIKRYKNGHFARHPTFRFVALNSLMRWQASKTGQIFVGKNSLSQMPVGELRDRLNTNPALSKHTSYFGSSLRSTRA